MKKNKKPKRFRYNRMTQDVVDELTGFIYPCNSNKTAKLLNDLNDKADENAELYWDLKTEYDKCKEWRDDCIERKEIIKEKLEVYFEVLEKYGIHSSTQLDELLNNKGIR